jgi:ABC transport system ATP-binding/permease protein
MSLVSLHHVTLDLAGQRLLDAVDWQIQAKARIALVGRNGAGKSTLLGLLQGELVADRGQIKQQSGLRIAGLMQEVPLNAKQENVYHFLVKGLGEVGEVLSRYHRLMEGSDSIALGHCQQQMDYLQAWDWLPRIEMMASRLDVDPNAAMAHLSGGMQRRALLAAALIASPDLLLLDEPTNHLDIGAIEWLESYLKSYSGSLLLVTHDRKFLSQVAQRIVEIDRGKLYSYDCDYETYLDRREALRCTEQRQNVLFDKRLAEEEAWLRTGIKARRTRNEGRVRALQAMREQYKTRRAHLAKVQALTLNVPSAGTVIIEAQKLNFQLANKTLVNDFSLLLTRGARLGIIGPNGCGKTTLLRLLLGELRPNSGTVRLGTSLEIAYFDQLRGQLDQQKTVMANVADGADYVVINGKQKHVATYLREFLFQPERFKQTPTSLSGGERNRLLLAKLFAKPVNLLVMDEPTNDLDIETLELLETMLLNYSGTLLLISHDRAFINNVVTSVLVYEGEGRFNEYLGGYEDYSAQKKQQPEKQAPQKPDKETSPVNKLSYNEQRELSQLPQKIALLEEKISTLQLKMAEPEFYQQAAKDISLQNQQLADNERELAKLYERWEYLEDRG